MKGSYRVILAALVLVALASGSGCELTGGSFSCYPFIPIPGAVTSVSDLSSPLSGPSQTAAQSAAVVAVAAGAPLPMLTAFPTCLPTLDLGVSSEQAQFGSMFTNFQGTFACLPTNNPVQFAVTEGPVQVTIEAAAVALPAPVSAMRVARFAIEGRSSITGGMASTTPSWTVQAGYLFPHSGSPTGAEPIVFGATLVDANDTGSATPLPAVASVNIDCGVGAPTTLPLNQPPVNIPVQATSACAPNCSCTANAVLSGGSAAVAGDAVQRLTVYAFNTNGLCGSNEMCAGADPLNPFCVADFGCSDGSVGMPCDHESQCDRVGGVICGASGFCEDGSAGATCTTTGDCIAGLGCVSNLCSAL